MITQFLGIVLANHHHFLACEDQIGGKWHKICGLESNLSCLLVFKLITRKLKEQTTYNPTQTYIYPV